MTKRSSSTQAKPARKLSPAEQADLNFAAGLKLVGHHPIFAAMLSSHAPIVRASPSRCPATAWAIVQADGVIHANPTRLGSAAEWAYVLAHCALHLGFGHLVERDQPRCWNAACDAVVERFLADLKFGRAPDQFTTPLPVTGPDEAAIYGRLLATDIPATYRPDMVFPPGVPAERREWLRQRWQANLALGVAQAVASAVDVAAGLASELGGQSTNRTLAHQAREWFISSYPLLGALAAAFTIIEDPLVCQREGVAVAAVSAETREIYINPAAGLTLEQHRFVMAHELLHVGLGHFARRAGRDPYYWNVATDFVINQWLVEMAIGELPPFGLLYDPQLAGLSAEAIYDRVVGDLRRYRRLATFRGHGQGDMLDDRNQSWWDRGAGCDLDEFLRHALTRGLRYHELAGRGFLPAGLIEEIHALNQPPIPWSVELARWFDHRFPPIERRRAYARPSRRQSATPEIPRPSWTTPVEGDPPRTFGVVLDTSGSMDRALLANALGAIASYAVAHDVPAVRVVFADAQAYDVGYMAADDIAGRVKVRGRGGTILQPAVNLLERATDFPSNGPILIITDGQCDRVTIRRDHAVLTPAGARLPFEPKGPVFRLR